MSKTDWKQKIINDLQNYRSYKADVKAMEIEIKVEATSDMGINYNVPSVMTSNIADFTGSKVMNILEKESQTTYKEKIKFVKKIDAYVEALPPAQKFIIQAKFYMREKDLDMDKMSGGGMRRDIDIYTSDKFGYEKAQYYRFYNKALKKLAEKLNYT